MTNRNARRAAKAADTALPKLPEIPNVSGTSEACSNCALAADTKRLAIIAHLNRAPAPPEDERLCLLNPGGGAPMKSWGWCSHWKAKA